MSKSEGRRTELCLRIVQILDCLAAKHSAKFSVAQFRAWAKTSDEPLRTAGEQTLRRDLNVFVNAGVYFC